MPKTKQSQPTDGAVAVEDRKPTTKSAKYQVPAVTRAFAILETLSVSETGLQVREIAKIHHIPYSTAFYLLETLAEGGYLRRSEDEKRYQLGHKLFRLAQRGAELPAPDLRRVAGPLLEELVHATGINGHIAILEGDEVIYIDKKEPPGIVRINTYIGRRNAAYRTSVGKALMMHLPEEEVRQLILPEKLVKKTDRTITTIDGLLADLRLSRSRGFACDDGEDGKDSRCVAAPIFDHDGKVMAAIGIVGVFGQIEVERFEPLGKLVRTYGLEISRRLGYAPPVTDINQPA